MTVSTVSTATAPPTVRARNCPLCETPAGRPCQAKPEGDHLARYLDAVTAGQLTREYMAAVLSELVTIHACVAITSGPPAPCCEAAAQLEEIRAVFTAFDWTTDDRQYALEQIESIANGGGQ